jgi:hypothetical protein
MSVQEMLAQKAANPNFVPPISDYRIGKRMFYNAIAFDQCTSDDMRSGWLAAESRTLDSLFSTEGLEVALAVVEATR